MLWTTLWEAPISLLEVLAVQKWLRIPEVEYWWFLGCVTGAQDQSFRDQRLAALTE